MLQQSEARVHSVSAPGKAVHGPSAGSGKWWCEEGVPVGSWGMAHPPGNSTGFYAGRFAWRSHSRATVLGFSRSVTTRRIMLRIWSVVSCAEIALSVSATCGVTLLLLACGRMFSGRNSSWSSWRITRSWSLIAGSVLNRSATSTCPLVSALTVRGPPESSGAKLLKCSP